MSNDFAIDYLPDVRDLAPALDGDALVLTGYAATLDLDRVNDRFDRRALADALTTYMATNPVVLFAHDKGKPPIGKVLEARVDAKGLWCRVLLPRPAAGTWASDIWHSARQGLLKAFSVGGRWSREAAAGYSRIVRADLHEISLAPVAVNGHAFASSVQQVQHVKAFSDGTFVPVDSDPIDVWDARIAAAEFRRDVRRAQADTLRAQLRLR